ncbi:negative regulation of cell proliferation [Desmophyllum pertusum]|uniref:Negative regulation of cell proliferation n=1 Tax=Desmophyllum pertusum TaxID=174260 RepID=A0A9X0A425_9CNID|nr:negative regulation of cell proliferation [Desmophyllum pertusum]
MKDEVGSAIKFLSEVLSRSSKVNQEQVQKFKDTLEQLIIARFENHWHPNKPLKGNAFRCLNIETTGIDPVLLKATEASGISPSILQEIFPGGLALWIDPERYRVELEKALSARYIVRILNHSNSKLAIIPKGSFSHCISTPLIVNARSRTSSQHSFHGTKATKKTSNGSTGLAKTIPRYLQKYFNSFYTIDINLFSSTE